MQFAKCRQAGIGCSHRQGGRYGGRGISTGARNRNGKILNKHITSLKSYVIYTKPTFNEIRGASPWRNGALHILSHSQPHSPGPLHVQCEFAYWGMNLYFQTKTHNYTGYVCWSDCRARLLWAGPRCLPDGVAPMMIPLLPPSTVRLLPHVAFVLSTEEEH